MRRWLPLPAKNRTVAACAAAGALFAAGVIAGASVTAGVARNAGEPNGGGSPPAVSVFAQPVYPAEVLRIMDGDTFEARVRIWPGLDVSTKVRLRGIDAPEMNARCAREQAAAESARDALAQLLAAGGIGIGAVTPDKYGGRVVASASARGTLDIGAALLAAGLVRSYDGGRRAGWCGILLE